MHIELISVKGLHKAIDADLTLQADLGIIVGINGSPIIFVQDKDFDDIIGTLPSDPRVVTLNRYSFENYLLEAEALIELALESKRRLTRKKVEEDLSINQYLDQLYESYRPLAELFVVAPTLPRN